MSRRELAYHADESLVGKLRRRIARLRHRRPVLRAPDRPMLSISFDDAPLTATGIGAEILEQWGARGTFYVAAGLAGSLEPVGQCADRDDYVRLTRRGHEIGCHTFSHLDCGRASARSAQADVALNAQTFRDWGLSRPDSFAYPYGDVSSETKAGLAPDFAILRGLHEGVIQLGSDLNQAPAVGIQGPDGEAKARTWMEYALSKRSWLILFTHDVQASPSPWGCTPDALNRLLRSATGLGFDVVTVREGAARLTV